MFKQLIVIASIHQPSTSTFELFDKLLLLSKGRTCYLGPTATVENHFFNIGYSLPMNVNPAEFILDVVSTDFSRDDESGAYGGKSHSGQPTRTAIERLEYIQKSWQESEQARITDTQVASPSDGKHSDMQMKLITESAASFRPAFYRVLFALLHRSFIKSNRDIIAYGVRIAMYLGLAIMMGTVWLRLHESQEYIQPFINAIVSFSAFYVASVLKVLIPNIHITSSLARPSCPSWQSHMYQHTSKTAQCSLKNGRTAYTEQLPSCSQTSSSVYLIYVSIPVRPKGIQTNTRQF